MRVPRVLIIDDSTLERYMLAHQLKLLGIKQLVEKSSAESALIYLQSCTKNKSDSVDGFFPELIILDVNMPVIDGFEFLKKFTDLLEKDKISSCQILMYTGSDNPEEHSRALQYDAVKGILLKGDFDLQQLREQVNSLNYFDDTI